MVHGGTLLSRYGCALFSSKSDAGHDSGAMKSNKKCTIYVSLLIQKPTRKKHL